MESNRIPGVQSNLNQTSQVSTNTRSVGSMSQYGAAPPVASLREGDVVKAEVTDLRNNEITIVLEDNTTLKGHLEGNSPLSIGDTAAFRLARVSPRGIVLETLSGQYSSSQLSVIRQALEEAGLPDNEKNREIVRELMNNKLPIHRQQISLILNQTYQTGSDDIENLVLMNKHHMTINQENLQQFADYRNSEHQLISRIEQFSEDLPSLLGALSENGPEEAVATFGHALLSHIDLSALEVSAENSLNFLSPEEKNTLLSLLQEEGVSGEELALVATGRANLSSVISILEASAGENPQTMSDTAQALSEASTQEDSTPEAPAAQDISDEILQSAEQEDNTAKSFSSLFTIGKQFAENARNTLGQLFNQTTASSDSSLSPKEELLAHLKTQEYYLDSSKLLTSALLSEEERQNLSDSLSRMPVSKTLITRISEGTATAKEVLQTIKNLIPLSDAKDIQNIFQSQEFHILFKNVLLRNYTLTPEDLRDFHKLRNFYPEMEKQFSSLENMIRSNLSGEDSQQFAGQAKDMQDNIQFMKTLNEMFEYVQLPLKLSRQNAHGDLYVYTKKDALKKHPEQIRVLLHLDLDSLGEIDVHITKNGNQVDTMFYTEETSTQTLIQNNRELLSDALAKKGYHSRIETEKLTKKPDIVKDFMEADLTHTDMKRYTFDIRA